MEIYNVIIMMLVWSGMLWIYFDGLKWAKSLINLYREKKRNQIKQIVLEYLKELQND